MLRCACVFLFFCMHRKQPMLSASLRSKRINKHILMDEVERECRFYLLTWYYVLVLTEALASAVVI